MRGLAILAPAVALGLFVATVETGSAQGLLDALNEAVEDPTLPVTATFKDTRIVNVQSNETPAEGVLHFVIAHRFGTLNSGAYELWGLDNAQMRMAFDYGITDRLAVGVARNTYQKTYEASINPLLRIYKNHRHMLDKKYYC